jgi:hypothetical protein
MGVMRFLASYGQRMVEDRRVIRTLHRDGVDGLMDDGPQSLRSRPWERKRQWMMQDTEGRRKRPVFQDFQGRAESPRLVRLHGYPP